MAQVPIGRPGSQIIVGGGTCVKSGLPTEDRVILRGATSPAWVSALFVFSFVSWLFAHSMSASRYVVEVPLRHEIYDNGQRINRVAWAMVLGGIAAAVVTSGYGAERSWMLLVVSAVGFVVLGASSYAHLVGVRQRGDELVLVRVHPTAAAAIRESRSIAEA